jgi:hypothetical protein
MEKTLQINSQSNTNTKTRDLVLSIIFDLIGMLSFAIPILGELADIVWAPIAGILLSKMYKGYAGKIGGFIVFIEELMPGLDIIPTFTLTWIYVYVIKGGKEE